MPTKNFDVGKIISDILDRTAGVRSEKAWLKKDLAERGYEHEMSKQNLMNAGSLGVEKERNIGALARQRLMGDTAISVADRTLEGTRYSADQGLKGHKYTSDRQLEGTKYSADSTLEGKRMDRDDPNKLLEEMIKMGVLTDEKAILEARKRLKAQNKMTLPSADDISSFIGGAAPGPTPIPASSKGAASMVFPGFTPPRSNKPRRVEDFLPGKRY